MRFFPYLFGDKKKADGDVKDVVEPKEPTPPKPTQVMMGILLVNNRTDKQYPFLSKNDFGINWKIIDGNILSVRQKFELGENLWQVMAVINLDEFSVIKTEWETKML